MEGNIMKWVWIFVGIVVLFTVIAQLYPDAAAAGDDLNASGFPLGSLFVGGGIVFLILAVGVIAAVIKGKK